MKLILSVLLAASMFGTTLTGTLNNPDGTGITGTLVLALAQQAALSASGSCGGPIEVMPVYQVKISVVAGAMTGSPHVYGNDCLLPQQTFYNVTMQDAQGNILFTDRWSITGTSIDVGTIVSVVIQGTTATLGSVGVVLTVPTATQVVNQPPGTNLQPNNLNVTQTLTMPNGAVCDNGGCHGGFISGAVDLTSAQTISGQKTFTSSLLIFNADLGDPTNAPNNIWANQSVIVNGAIKMQYAGTLSSPLDFFVELTSGVHTWRLVNGSGLPVAQFLDIFGDTGGNAQWFLLGLVQAGYGFANGLISGSDIPCNTYGNPNGLQQIRTDTNPPVLEACINNQVWKAAFTQ